MSRLAPAMGTLAALTILCALAGAPAQATGARTYVASTGDDSNSTYSCDASHPCRKLSVALAQTTPGGEILALDGAGYDALVIDRSVSIIANPGVFAGIGVGATEVNGVTIATAGVSVVLRGLTINGVGGMNGILMSNGAKLSIENCFIANFPTGIGVYVTTPAKLRIVDTVIRDNYHGVWLQGGASAVITDTKIVGNIEAGIHVFDAAASVTTTAVLTDTLVSGNYSGINAYSSNAAARSLVEVIRSTVTDNSCGVAAGGTAGSAEVSLSETLVSGNTVTGLYQSDAATLKPLGNNAVLDNAVDVTGTLTPLPPM